MKSSFSTVPNLNTCHSELRMKQ